MLIVEDEGADGGCREQTREGEQVGECVDVLSREREGG